LNNNCTGADWASSDVVGRAARSCAGYNVANATFKHKINWTQTLN